MPDDWHDLCAEACVHVRSLVHSIKNAHSLGMSKKQVCSVRHRRAHRVASLAGQILQCCDEISDITCALVDPAELCRNVHPAEGASHGRGTLRARIDTRV